MMDAPPIRATVEHILATALRIKPDETVLILSGLHNFALAEEFAVQVRCAGGFPTTLVGSDRLSQRLFKEVPLVHLRRSPRRMVDWLAAIDTVIQIDAVDDPHHLRDIPGERMRAAREGLDPYLEELSKKRWLNLAYPTRRKCELYGADVDEVWETYWAALGTDLEKIQTRGQRIAALAGDRLKLGDDLILDLADRLPMVTHGRLEAAGNQALPAGRVVALLDGAEGHLRIPEVVMFGSVVRDIELTIADGRIQKATAVGAEEAVAPLLRALESGDTVTAIGIGLNEGVTRLTGYPELDALAAGSVQLIIGDDTRYGGDHPAPSCLELPWQHADLGNDDRQLLVSGKWIL